jgi:hypothetical protein
MKAKVGLYTWAVLLLVSVGLAAGCNRGRNDAQISSDVQSKIYADPGVQSRQITVQASNGVVTLSGYTNTDAERATAASDAAQVEGVKTVVNNLQVSAPAQAAQAPEQQMAQEEPAPAPAPRARARSSAPRRRAPSPSASSMESSASSSTASSAPAVAEAPPPPPPAPKPVTVPSGTTISVRLIDPIDSEKNQTGQTFRATLDSPLVDESGNVVVPAGYDVTGRLADVKSAGRFAGQSAVVLELAELTVSGKSYALHTTQYTRQGSSRGKSTAKKVGAGAGIGALIGALAGGGKGAAIGATVGAGAGTGVSAATKGQQIVLPPETVLNFQLQGPISVIPTTQGPNAGRQRVQ